MLSQWGLELIRGVHAMISPHGSLEGAAGGAVLLFWGWIPTEVK